MQDDRAALTRREVLAGASGFGVTAGTGCLGTASSGTGSDSGGTGSGSGDGTEVEEADFRTEPVEYPDRSCEVDARNVREHPGWNAQVVHEDGTRAFLCTSGCMGAYYTLPTAFGVTEADIAGLWVTDYATGRTIDGTDAYYIFIGEQDLIDTPAGRNPLPFSDRKSAEEFTGKFEELSIGDVERFSKVNLNRCVW